MAISLLIPAVLLVVFHGVNPGMGWLFAVFTGTFKGKRHIVPTISVVAAGHMISVLPIVFLYVAIAQYSSFVPLIVGCTLLGFGAYRTLRAHRHKAMRLKVRYYQLLFWGILLGASHGAGISLIPFFGSLNLFLVLSAHFIATVTTMLFMAMITVYVFGTGILKKIWINFDLVWGVVLSIVGAGVILDYLA